eukprot:gene56867-biopygen42093
MLEEASGSDTTGETPQKRAAAMMTTNDVSKAKRTLVAGMVEDAGFLLPKQAILENFVHHNPWEMLQYMDYFKALAHIHKASCNMSPGERLFSIVQVDPRIRANEAVAELSAVFLDRGAAKWAAPQRHKEFIYFFASLEGLGFATWRKHARTAAKGILTHMERHPMEQSQVLAESILQENLDAFGILPEHWVATIQSMLWDMPGWAGMFQRMEMHPVEAPPGAKIRLIDYCAVHSILARSSIEALARHSGWDPSTPLGVFLSKAPTTCLVRHTVGSILGKVPAACDEEAHDESGIQNPSGLAFINQNMTQREAHEDNFEQTVLRAIGDGVSSLNPRPALQVYTCIDERECSFRRHLEDATDCREEVILAPEGAQPKTLIVDEEPKESSRNQRRRFLAQLALKWENASFSPVWSLLLAGLCFPVSIGWLFLMAFFPTVQTPYCTPQVDAVFRQHLRPRISGGLQ